MSAKTSKVNKSRTSEEQANDCSAPNTSQTQPKPAKNVLTRIPAPQAERIASRYISGESIRKISREEKRDRETVNRIVRSAKTQAYIADLRARYMALGSDAIKSVETTLKSGKDGRLAHQVLGDIGVIPSRRELHNMLHDELLEILNGESGHGSENEPPPG